MSDGWDMIHTYTRAQAIEDGVIVPVKALVPDEPDFARQAGYVVPVGLTASVAALVRPTEEESEIDAQDLKGRLWDVLMVGRFVANRNPDANLSLFDVAFRTRGRHDYPHGRSTDVRLKLHSGPGDEGEHVITIMLENED